MESFYAFETIGKLSMHLKFEYFWKLSSLELPFLCKDFAYIFYFCLCWFISRILKLSFNYSFFKIKKLLMFWSFFKIFKLLKFSNLNMSHYPRKRSIFINICKIQYLKSCNFSNKYPYGVSSHSKPLNQCVYFLQILRYLFASLWWRCYLCVVSVRPNNNNHCSAPTPPKRF